MYAPTPSPEEIGNFQQRRSSARSQYLNSISQAHYDRGQADLGKTTALQKYGVSFGRQREALPGGYANRGLLNSGIYQDALSRYGQDAAMAQGDILRGYQQTIGQVGINQGNAESTFAQNNLGIGLDEQSRRAAVAAALRSVL